MKDPGSTFSIKYPSSLFPFISLIFMTALQFVFLYLNVASDNDWGILLYAIISSLALCWVLFAIFIRTKVKKPSELVIHAQSLSLHNRIIEAGEIESVMIQ